jgi:hypothetical protein
LAASPALLRPSAAAAEALALAEDRAEDAEEEAREREIEASLEAEEREDLTEAEDTIFILFEIDGDAWEGLDRLKDAHVGSRNETFVRRQWNQSRRFGFRPESHIEKEETGSVRTRPIVALNLSTYTGHSAQTCFRASRKLEQVEAARHKIAPNATPPVGKELCPSAECQ